ncbi:MAG: hydrogen peroxide-inducible genes activator [Bacteroidia bacterium]
MTLTQLEYVIALDTYHHFGLAAEKCSVTQPTLSMQVHKLEEELGVILFDRSRQPVIPTEVGAEIISQARQILAEAAKIKEIIADKTAELQGELRMAIIPTLAPYLLPLFLPQFLQKYPKIKVKIQELTTENIIYQLKNDLLDVGVLVTPLQDNNIQELPLFYEALVAYLSEHHLLLKEQELKPEMIDLQQVWLLQQGHCLRSQVLNICQRAAKNALPNLQYESGNLETLRKFVEINGGMTFLPELATFDLSEEQMEKVRYFQAPEPVREVSLVTHRNFVKKRLIHALFQEIRLHIPQKMQNSLGKKVTTL